jgi:hypothetical protein
MVNNTTMPVRNVVNNVSRVISGVNRVVSSITGGTGRLGFLDRFQRMLSSDMGDLNRTIGSIMMPINRVSNAVSGVTGGISDIMSGMSNLTGGMFGGQRAGIMDMGLVSMQEGVQQRVIDTDIRRGAMSVEAVGEAVVGGIGSAKMRGPGGSERVTMSGGEAFKNVPLYVDDLGILLMQLGLV